MSHRSDAFYNILSIAHCEAFAPDLRESCKSLIEGSELAYFADPPFSNAEVESLAAGIYNFVFIPESEFGHYPDIQFSTLRAREEMYTELYQFASSNSEELLTMCLGSCESLSEDHLRVDLAKASFTELLIALMFRYRSAVETYQHVAASAIWRTAEVGGAIANNNISVTHLCAAIVCLLSLYDDEHMVSD